MADFLLTYPCYFVLRPNGWPDTVRTANGKALCLFTDDDLAERYCRAKRDAILARGGDAVTLHVFSGADAPGPNAHDTQLCAIFNFAPANAG